MGDFVRARAGTLRLFLGPLDNEKRIRQRTEASTAGMLYNQPGIVGDFQEKDIRYSRRHPDEKPIENTLKGKDEILGLSKSLLI